MPAVEPTTNRQRRLYEDTCDIWQPDTITLAADGKPTNVTTYTKIASSQKCFVPTTRNANTPMVIGRRRETFLQTLDGFRLPQGATIGDHYIVKVTTTESDLTDTFWQASGDPEDRKGGSHRKVRMRVCYLMQMKSAPAGVS